MVNGTISLPTHNRLDNVPSSSVRVTRLRWPRAGVRRCGVFQVVKTAQSRERTERTLVTATSQLLWRDKGRMAVKETPDLILRQSGVGCLDRPVNTIGDGIPCGHTEEKGSTGVAVISHGEGSLKMRQADDRGGVQGTVDGAEAQDLGLGATGGGAAQTGTKLAQGGIAILPKLAGRAIAAEEDFWCRGSPVEGAAEFAGDGGLQIRKSWQCGPWKDCTGAKYHDSTLLRFRMAVEKSLVTPEKGDFIWLSL